MAGFRRRLGGDDLDLRAPLARVRGLGSARDGTHHWWMQRVTAVALVPLTLWFTVSVLRVVGEDHASASAWLQNPFNAAVMLALLAAVFYHAYLGLRVVLEDYVHTSTVKVTSLLLIKFALVLLALVAMLSVARVFLGG